MRRLARFLAPLPVLALLPTLLVAPADAAASTAQSTYVGGSGVGDGALATHATVSPLGLGFAQVASDSLGRVVFADSGANEIRRIDADGTIERVAGDGDYSSQNGGFAGDGGPATEAKLSHPHGLVIASDGTMYIADSGNHRIRAVSPGGTISTIAGTGVDAPSATTQPAATAAVSPSLLALGADGSLYFIENGGGYDDVRVIRPDGTVALVAGNTAIDPGRTNCGSDLTQAIGPCFDGIASLAVDSAGNVFFGNSHAVVYKVAGATLTRAVGTGIHDSTGDGGPATDADLNGAYGLTFAPDGTLLIQTGGALRAVSPGGTISTDRVLPSGLIGPIALSGTDVLNVTDRVTSVASNGTATDLTGNPSDVVGDGLPAKDAHFHDISAISALASGSTLVGDRAGRVWTVDQAGLAHLVAGTTLGQTMFSGEGGQATAAVLPAVTSVAGAPDGSFYIGGGDGTVRQVAVNGVITTVAGTGTPGTGTDAVTAATTESIGAPRHLMVSSDGTVYFLDVDANRVRMLSGGNLQTVVGGGSTTGRAAVGLAATAINISGATDLEPTNDGGLLADVLGTLYHVAGGTVTNVQLAFGDPMSGFAAQTPDGALIVGMTGLVHRIAPDGSSEELSDLIEARSGYPIFGFGGGGTFSWANDSQSSFGGYSPARDRLWTMTVPTNTPRPPKVAGASYGADANGAYVSWTPPADPDLTVVPVLRDGANQPAASFSDGKELFYSPDAPRATVTLGEDNVTSVEGRPITVSLFTESMSSHVVSAPLVISWTPRYYLTCKVTRSVSTVRYGTGLTITGTLASGAAGPASNQPATLTAKAANGHVSTLLNGTTSSTGTVSVINKPPMNTTYTVAHAANFFMPCSASIAVAVQSAMTATLAATKILHGRTTTLTVTVGPNEAGQYVTLQKLSGTKWVNVSTVKLASTSKARWTVGSKTARKIAFRVRKLADRDHVLSYSQKVVLTVR